MCFKDVRKYVDDCAVCRCVSVCMRMWVRARICLCVCVWTHTCVSFHQHFSVQYKALSVQVSTSHVLNDMPWSLLSHLFTSATPYRHTTGIPPPPPGQSTVCLWRHWPILDEMQESVGVSLLRSVVTSVKSITPSRWAGSDVSVISFTSCYKQTVNIAPPLACFTVTRFRNSI